MRIEEVLKTEESKLNFLKGMIRLAKSDGVIDEQEILFFNQVAFSLELSESSRNELEELWKIEQKISVEFENRKEGIFFLVQAIQLSWVDGDYSQSEKDEIRSIAKELNIEENVVLEVEKWVNEGMEWNRRGDILIEM